jgi:hypothetical protein
MITGIMRHMVQHKLPDGAMNLTTDATIMLASMMLVLAVTTSVVRLCRVWSDDQKARNIGDPKEWPILGAQLEAGSHYEQLLDWITGFFNDDHRTVRIRLLARTAFFTVDPDNVEHILKSNFSNYPKVRIWLLTNTQLVDPPRHGHACIR